MPYVAQNGQSETQAEVQEAFAQTPFIDPRVQELEEPHEASPAEAFSGKLEFFSPFLPGESEASESEAAAEASVAEFSEITSELKDTLFREALEQLADEALEAQ